MSKSSSHSRGKRLDSSIASNPAAVYLPFSVFIVPATVQPKVRNFVVRESRANASNPASVTFTSVNSMSRKCAIVSDPPNSASAVSSASGYEKPDTHLNAGDDANASIFFVAL